MYKVKIINGVATEKRLGVTLESGEYEVTSAQFLQAEIPCEASVSGGVVTIGGKVSYDRVAQTDGVPPVATEEQVRGRRDGLLSETDYTQMPDSPLTDDCKLAFAAYRQSLRDITAQTGFPAEVSWPVMPEAVNKA